MYVYERIADKRGFKSDYSHLQLGAMFSLNDSLNYYYYRDITDMRKGFDALCGIVRSEMKRNPLSGEVYIFMNRARTTIKILRWETGGLVIYHKRLESGRFEEPIYNTQDKNCHLQWTELVMMIKGISIQNRVQKKRYKIS